MPVDECPEIGVPRPAESLEFTGERFTPGTAGETEHEHLHRYLFARGLCAGRDVLDVASGEGYGSALLAAVARSVVGVELAADVVAHAARSYAAPNLTFREGSCTELPLPAASVDVVVSFETLEHIAEHERFLSEIKRVLRPAGLLVMSSPIRGVYSVGNPNPFHVRELTREEFEALLGAHFRRRVCLGQTPVVGSALLADDPRPGGVEDGHLFWRREDGAFSVASGWGPSPYVVALATDGELPAIRTGLLQDRPYMARLLGDLKEARDRASALEAEAGRREADALRLRTEEERLRADDERLRAELDRLRGENERLRAEGERFGGELEQLRTREAQARAEADHLRAEADHLRSEARHLRAEAEHLLVEPEALRKELERVQADGEARRLDAEQRAAELAASEAEARRLVTELERRDAALAQREAEVRHLRSELSHAGRPRWIGRWIDSLRRRAAAKRILASGLFDADWYRTTYARGGSDRDAVRHFVKYARLYALNPHPMFDTAYYLRHNPEVERANVNPLLHFIDQGAARGLRPHPYYVAEEYLAEAAARRGGGGDAASRAADAAAGGPARSEPSHERRTASESGENRRFDPRPIEPAAPPRASPSPPVARTLVVSHVLPFPPRAGNEYRIDRYLRWLRSAGHEVHLVVCPLPGEPLDPEAVRRAAAVYPDLVVCERDGAVTYRCERADVVAALSALRGKAPGIVRADPPHERTSERIAAVERTFCPPALLDVLSAVAGAVRPDVVIANYVFMTGCLPAVGRGALKVVDTHDVFSTKASKVLRYGVPDDLALSAQDERTMLLRADVVVAIQPDEARELLELVPERRVVTAGVDFELAPETAPARAPVVLYVASSNAMNVKGIREFLAFAWPLVRREVPDATLRLVGPICDAVDGAVDGIELVGRVDRLEPVYAEARVVINPSAAGTGLKIKTLEALANARPVVTWPSGVDGLGPGTRQFCRVASDWYAFARQVVEALAAGEGDAPAVRRDELARLLSADAVYAALRDAIEAGLARGSASTGTAA